MKTIAFYAGSFDPFTIGHLALIKQASSMFEYIIIGIGINPEKERRFSKEDMKKGIEETLKQENINNAKAIIYEGYTYEAAKKNNSTLLIRGLRNETDYIYEEKIDRTAPCRVAGDLCDSLRPKCARR